MRPPAALSLGGLRNVPGMFPECSRNVPGMFFYRGESNRPISVRLFSANQHPPVLRQSATSIQGKLAF